MKNIKQKVEDIRRELNEPLPKTDTTKRKEKN